MAMRNSVIIFALVLGAVILLTPAPRRAEFEAPKSEPPVPPAEKEKVPSVIGPAASIPLRGLSSTQLAPPSLPGWKVQRSPKGFVTRMSDGSIALIDAPLEMALQNFLNTHAEPLLGVPASSLVMRSQSKSPNETQFIYEQTHCGLPVFGSRLNLFVGGKNNLVYLRSDLHHGPFPPCEPGVSLAVAAASAASALRGEFAKRAIPLDEAVLAPDFLSAYGKIVYLLNESGTFLVYRFEIPFEAPIGIDLELVISAASGEIVSIKELQKN